MNQIFKSLVNRTSIQHDFEKACKEGDLEQLKIQLHLEPRYSPRKIMGFQDAGIAGHLNIVEYLTSSPELTNHIDIHMEGYLVFRDACQNGHLHIVQYLLTSPKLESHADIHILNDIGYIGACQNGHLDIVKYLAKSPDINEHANVKAQGYLGLKKALMNNYPDIVNFHLFDLNLQFTPERLKKFENYFDNDHQIDKFYCFIALINKRDLFMKLNEDVSHKEIAVKVKI